MKELGDNIDDAELQEMIEKADSDNDGQVTEEDFYNIMTKKIVKAWTDCKADHYTNCWGCNYDKNLQWHNDEPSGIKMNPVIQLHNYERYVFTVIKNSRQYDHSMAVRRVHS